MTATMERQHAKDMEKLNKHIENQEKEVEFVSTLNLTYFVRHVQQWWLSGLDTNIANSSNKWSLRSHVRIPLGTQTIIRRLFLILSYDPVVHNT